MARHKRRQTDMAENGLKDPWQQYVDPNGDWWEQQGWVTPDKMSKRLKLSLRQVYRLWREGILVRGYSKKSGVRFSLQSLHIFLYSLDEWQGFELPRKP